MKLENLKCCNEYVNLDEYLKLYKYVRDNMEHPEWLGTFTKEEIEDILSNGGKIWLYYDGDNMVSSMFYIPITNKSLRKHNVEYDESETGSLGPIMVSPDYVGNGLQKQMMDVLDKYCLSINKKYIFTKVCSDNIPSVKNIISHGYILTNKYINERGENSTFIKKI